MKNRYHRGSDPWGRGSFMVPALAIAGSSDTGMWDDSPAPSDKATEELKMLQVALRKATGIKSEEIEATQSGNVFMVKRWLGVLNASDFERAKAFADKWLVEHKRDTRLIHNADGEEIDDPVYDEEEAEA